MDVSRWRPPPDRRRLRRDGEAAQALVAARPRRGESALTNGLMFHLSILGALLHLAVSGAVTVHVLLRKRDVRAATAWIGVAWLSPGFGAALYYVFGINRVMRRTSRMVRGVTPRKALVAPRLATGETGYSTPEISGLPENIATIARVSALAS